MGRVARAAFQTGFLPEPQGQFSIVMNMNLSELLVQNRSSIVKKWCDLVLETYPEQSQNFLRKQKDQFANPVGRTIFEGIESIYDQLVGEGDANKISLFLDNIIRVRAIQEFSPSQAVGFIFGLKRIIKDKLEREIQQNGISEEWGAFEPKIDTLALLCFDIYTKCRQEIFNIRVNEVRNQSHRLLKMAGLAYELPETEGDLKDGDANSQ
jgi:hypothetical protein